MGSAQSYEISDAPAYKKLNDIEEQLKKDSEADELKEQASGSKL